MKTLLALEPRILFDGAALATGAEIAQDQTAQDQSIPGTDADAATNSDETMGSDSDAFWSSGLSPASPADRREIVFIDTRVEDYQTLMEGIHPAAEVILLDAGRDGIEQIAEALKGQSDIDAIHLIGEGTEAEMHLGTAFLTTDSISQHYAALLSQIGQSLSADADLLIYGCNFGRGQAGLSAMQTLAELTGADIAASTDRTGHVSEYANWDLEVSTGFIETSIAIGEVTQAAWEGVLATYTVTTTTDGGAGSLRQAIIDANANAGTDTITFVGNGTYLLTIAGTAEDAAATGDLDITESLIINGNGIGNTVIDGGGIDRVFHIRNNSTVVTISALTIQGGSMDNEGGGIFIDDPSTLNLSDALLQNNDGNNASGAGEGGAIHVHGTLNLNRVLISNNLAKKGAGIYFHNADGGTLTNVTISGNTAVDEGGGIWTENPITFMNSTIAFNTAPLGGGVYDKDGMEITTTNSILHNPGSPNSFGTLISGGNNIDSDSTAGLGDPLDGVDPMLGALADNGGPTLTHALLAGSPALNAGTTTGAPAVDQRGLTRDAAPDIGAYEFKSSSFVSKNEFMVNAPSGDNEQTSGLVRGAERAVDIAPNGDYVVVWTNETSSNQVWAKAFDSNGNERFAQFQVNISGGSNKWADVAVDDNGNFVVAWTQGNDIYMRRFMANGTAVDAGDMRVNTLITNQQENPSINMNGGGDFVIAWEGTGGGNEGIFARQGSFGGGLIGSDITVNAAATAQDPSVAIDDSGNFVVVLDDGADVLFQLYNSAGVVLNSGQVDGGAQFNAGGAAVEMRGDGRFTVAYRYTNIGWGIDVRQFDAAGTPLSQPFLVNTSTLNNQTNPSITMDDIGEFIVVWEGFGNQLNQIDSDGVFGQKFNADGQKIGFEFLINQTTVNVQDRASLAMLDRDNFVAVWTGSDGAQTDVFARQYGATTSPTLDLDANNSSGATGNDYAVTFNEGDGPTAIADSDTDLADVDSTTFSYVTVSLSGLLDGNAEALILEGDTFALATDAPGQDTTGGNYHVRVSTAPGTAIVSIIKQGGGTLSEVETETLIKAIQYQHTDTSTPTDGARLIEVRVNDGTTDSAAARTTINVNPVNDPPVLVTNNPLPMPEGNTQTITSAYLAATDADNTSTQLVYTLTQLPGGTGQVRLNGSPLGLGGPFTQDDIDNNRVTLRFTDNNQAIVTSFKFTLSDGIFTSSDFTFSINGQPINDPPVFSGLDNTPIFNESGAAVVLDNNATISDIELDAANNYSGATLTLVRNGGANANDLLNGTGTLNPLIQGGNLRVGATTIGTVTTNSGGTLVLTFNNNATTAVVNSALQQITYANSNANPPANVQIDFSINDGNAGGQGTGGALSDAGSITVTINAVNNSPTVDLDVNDSSGATGNDYAVTYSEGAGPIGIADSDPDLSDPDSVTFAYVKLALSGLLDGNAEVLLLDGDTFVLATAVAGQDTSGGNYSVIMTTAADTATITITKQGGGTFTETETETLINAIQYNHTDLNSPTDGDRLIDVIVNDGAADSNASRTTINVNPVNDPPVLSGLDNTPTFTEGGIAVVLDNNATITDPEMDAANNYNGATLTLIRNGGGNADVFNGSGTLLPLVESGNMTVGITTIGTVTTNSAGTLVLTFNSNATTALVNSALQQITYANSSGNPPASVQIDYMFSDGNAGSQGTGGALNDSGSVTVSIIAINNSPIAIPDNLVVNEGSSTTLNLAGNDLDLDDGLDLTSITIISGPPNGTITGVNANGTVDYTHDGSETLTDSFTYTIRDLAGAISNTVTVSLTVTPVNDAPIITSNGGGANANIFLITGTTGVTDVDAIDADGNLLTYSIIGGADAALFSIDPTTGILTFITAPNFQTPGDVGADNVYDVIVQASDGTAVDTQAIAVTVTQANVPPQIFIPPSPDLPSSPDPLPRDAGEETSEDQAPGNGGSLDPGSPGNIPDGGQGSTITGAKDSVTENTLGRHELPAKQEDGERTGIVGMVSDMWSLLRKPIDITAFQDEIRSLLTRSRFLQDLDRVRDSAQDVAATEKTYLASSIAVSTGLSIGYVVWLLRSGVLLTALLSSVPAWQFVNPLLVLDAAAKKKRQNGQKDVEGDSVESLFEKPTASPEIAKEKTGNPAQASRPRWFRWNRP